MANADKTLLNKDNLEIYPLTRERNVYDENNVNLKEKFKNVVFKDNEVHKFSQELYEESTNELEIKSSDIQPTNQGVTMALNNDGGIHCAGTVSSNYFNIVEAISCYFPKGDYAFSVNKKLTQYSLFLSLTYSDGTTGQMAIWKNSSSNIITFTKDVVKYSIFAGEATSGNVIDDILYIQLQKGKIVTTYKKYNQNRHITNSEAEFLKEEFNRQENILQLQDIASTTRNNLTYSLSNGELTLNGTASAETTIQCNVISNIEAGTYSYNDFKEPNNINIGFSNDTYMGGLYGVSKGTVNFLKSLKTIQYVIPANVSFNNFKIKPMIVKGNVIPTTFGIYNQNRHITNAQADLLKSEYNRSANELYLKDITNYSQQNITWHVKDGVVYKSGTVASGGVGITLTLKKPLILKKGETYTFVNLGTPQNMEVSIQKEDNTNVMTITYNANSISYTPTEDITITKMGYWIRGNTVVSNDYFMVIKGTELPKEFNQWNGSIIREKDIKPVLVWENATPSSGIGFTADIALNIGNVFDYKFGYLEWYISTNINSLAAVITRVEFMANKNNYLRVTSAIDDNGSIATRTLAITVDGKLLIQNCFVGGAEDNKKIIPFKFYVSNY